MADVPAYARLVNEYGAIFEMRELEMEMGREKRMEGAKYWCVAESNTISKNHAHIFWNDGAFYINNLSKNKIHVNFKEVMQGAEPVQLYNMSPIMISKIRVYFLLPHNTIDK